MLSDVCFEFVDAFRPTRIARDAAKEGRHLPEFLEGVERYSTPPFNYPADVLEGLNEAVAS